MPPMQAGEPRRQGATPTFFSVSPCLRGLWGGRGAMKKSWIVGLALLAALALPAFAAAHTGHLHKVMGTVSAVTPTKVEVKTTDGKTMVILLDAKTVYRKAKLKVDVASVKVGGRVVIDAEGADAAKPMTAKTVQLPAS